MWCEKCHYGSETVKWKLDSDGKFFCGQCRTLELAIDKNPFMKKKSTYGRKEKPDPKKFKFDQKDGKDSNNPVADRPSENAANKPSNKSIEPAEQQVEKPVDKHPEPIKQAVEQPTKPQKEQSKPMLEPIDEAKLTPFVAQPKSVEPEGQNQAIPVVEKK